MPAAVSASTSRPASAPGASACTRRTSTGLESWIAGGGIETLAGAGAATGAGGRATAASCPVAPLEVDGACLPSRHAMATARARATMTTAIHRRRMGGDAVANARAGQELNHRCDLWPNDRRLDAAAPLLLIFAHGRNRLHPPSRTPRAAARLLRRGRRRARP